MPLTRAEFQAVRKENLYEEAVQQIHCFIRNGLLEPSDKFPLEREFAAILRARSARAVRAEGERRVRGGDFRVGEGPLVNSRSDRVPTLHTAASVGSPSLQGFDGGVWLSDVLGDSVSVS